MSVQSKENCYTRDKCGKRRTFLSFVTILWKQIMLNFIYSHIACSELSFQLALFSLQGHHPQLGAHEKFTNYLFNVNEFMKILQKAVKLVTEKRKHSLTSVWCWCFCGKESEWLLEFLNILNNGQFSKPFGSFRNCNLNVDLN